MNKPDLMKSIIYGKAVGDALGVPVEFKDRDYLSNNPVIDMIGFGTYNMPAGTWSDDTSMALALLDGLIDGGSLEAIASKFVNWFKLGRYTPNGNVFDIGRTTLRSIRLLDKGISPLDSGNECLDSKSNGSLMRTLVLVPDLINKTIKERYDYVSLVSAITHGNFACKFACFFIVEYAIMVLKIKDKVKYGLSLTAFILTQDEVLKFIEEYKIEDDSLVRFNILLSEFEKLREGNIGSGGYVMDTLEASIWCILETDSYDEAVLKAVNLGNDTDTTAAVTGALGAIIYGYDNINKSWIDKLVNKELIDELLTRYEKISQ